MRPMKHSSIHTRNLLKFKTFHLLTLQLQMNNKFIYMFSTYYVPYTALGLGEAMRNETDKTPHSHATYILTEEKEEENPINRKKDNRLRV